MKTETRSDDPGDKNNWGMDCSTAGCGMRFGEDVPIGVVAEHWNLEHVLPVQGGAAVTEAMGREIDKPQLTLVWIGVGQPPEARS